MSAKSRIVFFGSPEFAAPSLKALLSSGREVLAAATQPDRPKGRGRKPAPPPVKTAAAEAGVEVLQPESVRTEEFCERMRRLEADLFVVVAFGRLLSRKLLEIPRRGCVNVHASLLPAYRGPAPIQWAVANGEAKTGVTTMMMEEKLDAGDILLQAETRIRPDDTAGSLHDRLALLGADLLAQTLDEMEAGSIVPTPQDHSRATYAPMLVKSHGRIDWRRPAEEIERLVRGMHPWPGTFAFLKDRRIKIFGTEVVPGRKGAAPGTVLEGFENELRVQAGDGDALSILELQAASGKRLPIKDFLAGNSIPPGTALI